MAPMFKESQLLMVESNPHFSPNGQLIAFTGEYDGNMDV
jgi:Tol biopolymer transport system component